MSGGAIGYAIAAAMCLALASALQHQAATAEQGYRSGIHLLWRLARNRRWAAGLAAAAAGVIMHAAALHAGTLAVVQTVLVMSVALALPARALLDRARPSGGQMLAGAVLAAGVAIFVTAAHPRAGQAAPDGRGAAAVIAAGVALAILGSVAAVRARSGRVTGFALGVAAGTLYGLAGGVLKAAVHAVLRDPATAITGWPPWALAVLGAWGFIIHQRAYTHAPLGASLPALSVANPLAGMAFGTLVFGETPAHGPLALLGETLGMAIIIGSVAMLARSPAAAGPDRDGPIGLRPEDGPGQPETSFGEDAAEEPGG
jgi:drug/metabolite transporter (DMT)-like permease